jgi:hypothetical protein
MDDNGALAPLITSCLCNEGNGNSAQEGSGHGASPPLITPRSRNANKDSGSGADDNTSALLVLPQLCHDDSGSGVQEGSNNGALAS